MMIDKKSYRPLLNRKMIDIIPFLTFAIVTSFTPGPNNISALAFSLRGGYRYTLNYILGIAVGTFVVMLICAWLSFGLSQIVPEVATYLKYVGALYILFLAYKVLKMNLGDISAEGVRPQFLEGAILQLVNPKAAFYGMTVYSVFLNGLVENRFMLLLSSIGLAIYTFVVVTVWALSGTVIKNVLKSKTGKTSISVLMAVGLLYTAIDILLS